MGNPPWIAFRHLEPAYQDFVKRQVAREYRILSGRGHLITHLEVATLFLVRAADLYLKPGGVMGFVMPRSVCTGEQHDGLRRNEFRFPQDAMNRLAWTGLWDCDRVKPLFNVPTCVLWAQKTTAVEVIKSFPGEVLAGSLPRKNASLTEAEANLTVEAAQFSLSQRGRHSFWATGEATKTQKTSPYKRKFFQGATMVPRSFWFVQVKPSPIGLNPDCPPLETDPRATKMAKKPYKNVNFTGQVESRFLYATLLSTDLLPFGNLDYRMTVLPIETEGKINRIIDSKESKQHGFVNLSKWLETAEKQWQELRGNKAEAMNIYQRIDRFHGLIRQNLNAKYRVVYPLAATNLCAAMIETKPIDFNIGDQFIASNGLFIDHALYYLESNDKDEVYFLTSILNSSEINNAIKPMQARGLFGPHDIHKKIFELPIPKFDARNNTHLRLGEIGECCAQKVRDWRDQGGPGQVVSIGRLRGMVRQMLNSELSEIDVLVASLLQNGAS
jgi:hypothetical protein